MAPEDACSADMLVLIRWHGRTLAVPLLQLVAIDLDQSSAEAILFLGAAADCYSSQWSRRPDLRRGGDSRLFRGLTGCWFAQASGLSSSTVQHADAPSNLAFRQLKHRSLRPTTDAVALPQPEPRAVG
jgi:hypothetical protein